MQPALTREGLRVAYVATSPRISPSGEDGSLNDERLDHRLDTGIKTLVSTASALQTD